MNAAAPSAQPVVILGAGHGTRMGGPKVFAEVGGVTFLQRIVDRIGEACCPAVLTVDAAFRARVEALLMRLPRVRLRLIEVDGNLPMLASVQTGLAKLDAAAQGAWLWPVDAPMLSAEGWLRARQTVAAQPQAILKLRTQGRTGHPIWLPRWACEAVAEGRWSDGLQGFLAEVPAGRIAHLELPGETLGDFNTPEQLAAVRR